LPYRLSNYFRIRPGKGCALYVPGIARFWIIHAFAFLKRSQTGILLSYGTVADFLKCLFCVNSKPNSYIE
jgi:hypothetical protein